MRVLVTIQISFFYFFLYLFHSLLFFILFLFTESRGSTESTLFVILMELNGFIEFVFEIIFLDHQFNSISNNFVF